MELSHPPVCFHLNSLDCPWLFLSPSCCVWVAWGITLILGASQLGADLLMPMEGIMEAMPAQISLQFRSTSAFRRCKLKICVPDNHGSIYSLAILIPYGNGCFILHLLNLLSWASASPEYWSIKQWAKILGGKYITPPCFQYGHRSARTWGEQNGCNLGGSADIYCEKQLGNNQSNCSGPMYMFLMSLVAEGLFQRVCIIYTGQHYQ